MKNALHWRLLAALVGLSSVVPVQAGESIGGHTVRSVTVRTTGNLQFVIGAHANPGACTRPGKAMVEFSHPGRAAMLATLVTVKASRGSVELVVDGCVNLHGQTYPRVRELAWR